MFLVCFDWSDIVSRCCRCKLCVRHMFLKLELWSPRVCFLVCFYCSFCGTPDQRDLTHGLLRETGPKTGIHKRALSAGSLVRRDAEDPMWSSLSNWFFSGGAYLWVIFSEQCIWSVFISIRKYVLCVSEARRSVSTCHGLMQGGWRPLALPCRKKTIMNVQPRKKKSVRVTLSASFVIDIRRLFLLLSLYT